MKTRYLWDPIEDNVIAEFDEGGNLIVEYTTEPELYGDVISQRRDGETNCFYSGEERVSGTENPRGRQSVSNGSVNWAPLRRQPGDGRE